jgi:choline monooxygenase
MRRSKNAVVQSCGSKGTDARLGEGVVYGWVFPGLFFNRYGDMVDVNWVVPKGPTRCEVVFDWFAIRALAGAPETADSIARSLCIQQQDVQICESVQRGLASGRFVPAGYAPGVDDGVKHFHRLLEDAVARKASSEARRA